MYCKKCGNKLREAAKFCEKCGQNIDAVNQIKSQKIENIGKNRWRNIGIAVLAVVLFYTTYSFFTQLGSSSPDLSNQTSSERAELISDTVREIKSTTNLPSRIDDVTIWEDVTPQPNAIRYHYTLVGADTTNLSSDYLKNHLKSSLCSDKDTRYVLDQGIGMEYSYVVQGTTQSYLVSITKMNCI